MMGEGRALSHILYTFCPYSAVLMTTNVHVSNSVCVASIFCIYLHSMFRPSKHFYSEFKDYFNSSARRQKDLTGYCFK